MGDARPLLTRQTRIVNVTGNPSSLRHLRQRFAD